jgi:hypothetical protein
MTSLAHISAAAPLRTFALPTPTTAGVRVRLLPSGDGWSLVGPDGKVVFQALGTGGRRECLRFAQAHGVLAVFS